MRTELDAALAKIKALEERNAFLTELAKSRDNSIKRKSRQIDALQKRLDDIQDSYRRTVLEQCAGDELHCSCVPALRAEIKYLKLGKSIWRHSWSWENTPLDEIKRLQAEISSLQRELKEVWTCNMRLSIPVVGRKGETK